MATVLVCLTGADVKRNAYNPSRNRIVGLAGAA